ncbi:hypothetical protein Rhal01_00472 [Rubritalea halochordaticola]|uniref:DUF2238 domain-containing protein n=1 Tax=Rubritalea halochordaticola TaxID=714537 RepID=A0ABP9UZ45_9BACT
MMNSYQKHTPLMGLIVFNCLYIAGAVVMAMLNGNTEFVYYVSVLILLIIGAFIAHKKINYTAPLLWALSFWGLAHLAGGLLTIPENWPTYGGKRVLYSLWLIPGKLKYDQLVHCYGFAVTTWLSWQTLASIIHQRYKRRLQPTFGVVLLCATSSMGYGALNEVIEFFATLMISETNVGGYANTSWDLVYNTIGALMAAIAISAKQRY